MFFFLSKRYWTRCVHYLMNKGRLKSPINSRFLSQHWVPNMHNKENGVKLFFKAYGRSYFYRKFRFQFISMYRNKVYEHYNTLLCLWPDRINNLPVLFDPIHFMQRVYIYIIYKYTLPQCVRTLLKHLSFLKLFHPFSGYLSDIKL